MSKGNVLVTGGAGYVGSHTCKALAQAAYTPVTYDNLSIGNRWAVKWGPLELGDILDSNRVNEVFKKHRPIAMMHFAAFALVGESMQEPSLYYRNNVTGTINLVVTPAGCTTWAPSCSPAPVPPTEFRTRCPSARMPRSGR